MNGETPRVTTCSWRYGNSLGQCLPWVISAKPPWTFPRPGQPARLLHKVLSTIYFLWPQGCSALLGGKPLGLSWLETGSCNWNLCTETHGITSLRTYAYVEIAARIRNGQQVEESCSTNCICNVYFLNWLSTVPFLNPFPSKKSKQYPGNAAVLYFDVISHKSKC